jgi:hypothetical protein
MSRTQMLYIIVIVVGIIAFIVGLFAMSSDEIWGAPVAIVGASASILPLFLIRKSRTKP